MPSPASSIPESSVRFLATNLPRRAREQSHALGSSLRDFAAMFTTSRMLWVLAAFILLIFARL